MASQMPTCSAVRCKLGKRGAPGEQHGTHGTDPRACGGRTDPRAFGGRLPGVLTLSTPVSTAHWEFLPLLSIAEITLKLIVIVVFFFPKSV